MTNTQKTIAEIRAWMKEGGRSRYTIARKANLSKQALRGMDSDSWNPTASTLAAIEALMEDAEEERDSRRE
ncbi:MAG: hypothetical protein ACR2RE_28155 [Geminicoccaceae bacterium]